MDGEAPHVVVVGEPDQPGTHQRAAVQVEQRLGQFRHERPGMSLGFGVAAEVDALNFQATGRPDDLYRSAVA